MQVKTERGIISVDDVYQSGERAEIDGYSYSFTTYGVFLPDRNCRVDKADCYSKFPEGNHNCRTFALVVRG